ncbi:MAG: preprotein translocase subunit SecE [Chitinophagaceae bacterium]|nr:preprotein translocase subunit SecE [Chitinophagaceae bacterium]MBL0333840.1 preprotein translocase subunit SecE [Chitinophagaceae bacterium]
MHKIAIYFRDSYKELTEKVTWPTWLQLQQSTMIVLAATIVITFIILAMDFVAGKAFQFIYESLFK